MPQAMSDTFTLELPSATEILMTRKFAAKRDLVYAAHTSCEHVRNWWGGRDSIFTTCEMDFRPGGRWRYVLQDAEGNEFGFRGEYREIVTGESITYTFEFEGLPGHICLETIALEDDGEGTLMRNLSRYDSQEERDGMVASMEGGPQETLDRLDEYTGTLS